MVNYPVDIQTFGEGFPPGTAVPPLLDAFARWLTDAPHPSLGAFDGVWSEFLDATYVRNEDEAATVKLRKQLGIFLHLPDGSRLALWYHGAAPPAVVLLGSEGELQTVAPSLEAFLMALGDGRTGIGELDDVAGADRRPLNAWLVQQGVTAPVLAEPPDFRQWFETTVAAG
jgi:hypothetical protein